MQQVGKILKSFIADYGIEAGVNLVAINHKWKEIVGEAIAVHTSPDIIKGKTLSIVVDTPQWLHHLSFYRTQIAEKLKPYGIDSVTLRIGKIVQLEQDTSFFKVGTLSEDDRDFIEKTISSLRDDELKIRFRKLLQKALSKKE
jgi:hypothetical protein